MNSIIGEYVAIEDDTAYPVTKTVSKYERNIGCNTTVTVYDSPGLQDGTKGKEDEKLVLNKLKETCREVDLYLYCVKMNDTVKMQPSEVDAVGYRSAAIS